jgi:hypothetical protein
VRLLLAAAAALLLLAPAQAEVLVLSGPVTLETADPTLDYVQAQDPTGKLGAVRQVAEDTLEDLEAKCFLYDVPSGHETALDADGSHVEAFVNSDDAPGPDHWIREDAQVGAGLYYGACPVYSSPVQVCLAARAMVQFIADQVLDDDITVYTGGLGSSLAPAPTTPVPDAVGSKVGAIGGFASDTAEDADHAVPQDFCEELRLQDLMLPLPPVKPPVKPPV